MQNFCLLLTHH